MSKDKIWESVLTETAYARQLFPKPNHLVLAMVEESGEVVKATLDLYSGKDGATENKIKKEIIQLMAMCIRLLTEGDPTVKLKPIIKDVL